jgi:hypothetical protein
LDKKGKLGKNVTIISTPKIAIPKTFAKPTNPAQQVDYFHSPSAERRDSLFYYTRSEFQNIRILRFLSDIVWSISIHTDKKRNRAVFIVFVSGMLGCIYQIIFDLILDF